MRCRDGGELVEEIRGLGFSRWKGSAGVRPATLVAASMADAFWRAGSAVWVSGDSSVCCKLLLLPAWGAPAALKMGAWLLSYRSSLKLVLFKVMWFKIQL